MQRTKVVPALPVAAIALLIILACNLPSASAPPSPGQAAVPQTLATNVVVTAPPSVAPPATDTATAAVTHALTPSTSVSSGKPIYDVVSEDTAPEKRAPYGDSYDINRLERPFLQDMAYAPNLDIASFAVSSDDTWWYVSIALVGNDPNDALGIDYGVELDTDHDGFGNYLIWAHPPYTGDWDTAAVQIFQDNNHDTGGRSGEKSDAPITTDGYETVIFHGGPGDPDPDMAWVRTIAGSPASVQFAFKKSWSGTVFMLGVMADAGLKDPKQLDYVDRFTIAEAGSPIRANSNYPLKALYAVDNVCRAPFGFKSTGYEPQLCPSTEPPATKKPKPTGEPATEEPPPGILPPPPIP